MIRRTLVYTLISSLVFLAGMKYQEHYDKKSFVRTLTYVIQRYENAVANAKAKSKFDNMHIEERYEL